MVLPLVYSIQSMHALLIAKTADFKGALGSISTSVCLWVPFPPAEEINSPAICHNTLYPRGEQSKDPERYAQTIAVLFHKDHPKQLR